MEIFNKKLIFSAMNFLPLHVNVYTNEKANDFTQPELCLLPLIDHPSISLIYCSCPAMPSIMYSL